MTFGDYLALEREGDRGYSDIFWRRTGRSIEAAGARSLGSGEVVNVAVA